MKITIAALSLMLLFCHIASAQTKRMDALYEKMCEHIPPTWEVMRTDSGFVLVANDSVWFYTELNPHIRYAGKNKGYVCIKCDMEEAHVPKEILKVYVVVEKRWRAREIKKAVALNDSVRNALERNVPRDAILMSTYWDYDWQGDEKILFDKIRKVPTFSAGRYSVTIFDNRWNSYVSSVYPLNLQREELLTIIPEKVFGVKVPMLRFYSLYWGCDTKWSDRESKWVERKE